MQNWKIQARSARHLKSQKINPKISKIAPGVVQKICLLRPFDQARFTRESDGKIVKAFFKKLIEGGFAPLELPLNAGSLGDWGGGFF